MSYGIGRVRVLATVGVVTAAVLVAGACFAEAVQTQSASELGNKDCGKSETAIGDLVSDAMRKTLRTDIVFVAASELKPKDPPFPAGKVSSPDITALVSYSVDPLAVLHLSGRTVRAALERSISIYPQPNQGFLQVSGLKFVFDPSKPAGERVTSVTVGRSPLSDTSTYSVGVTSSMANGALGYWKVWGQETPTKKSNTSIVKAVEEYFKSNPKIDYAALDRISAAK